MTDLTRAAPPAVADDARAADAALMHAVFPGQGEMAARCRALDWAGTPLGPVAGWSAALRAVVRLALETPLPACVWAGPAYVLLHNDAYRRFFGARYPGALGRPGAVVWHEAWPQLGPQLDSVWAGGPALVFEDLRFVLERPDGGGVEEAWFTYTLVPVRDEAGTVVAVYNASTETTARVRAEAERARLLAAAEAERQRLAAVIAHLPVGVTFAEAPAGQHAESNPAAVAIWGVVPASPGVEAYSRDFVGYRPGPGAPGSPEEAARRIASAEWPLARALLTGEVVRDELAEIERPDGTRRLVSLNAAPMRDTAGRVTGALVTTVDVSERERLLTAERLAASQAHLLQALTTALGAALTPAAVVRVVLEHGVPALGAVTGLVMLTTGSAPDAADGAPTVLTCAGAYGYPPGYDVRFARVPLDAALPVAAAAREHRAVWVPDPEAARAYSDLPAIYAATGAVATAALPLADADGRVFGALAFHYPTPQQFDDARRAFKEAVARQCAQALERARLFAAAEAARTAAEAANRAKAEFLATMSHELRTPLNAIAGYAELLAIGVRGPLTEPQARDLDRLRRANQHLTSLVTDVLNFARLDAGRVEYRAEPVRLGPLVADLESLVGPQLAAKRLTYDHDGCGPETPEQPHVVRGDPEKVRQILLNLLTNAIKFTEPGGRVTLVCEGDAAVVRVRITDTGRGIAREAMERIFEPFVQVDRHRTADSQQGVGLGLAISRDLARGMGGDLTVDSTPGVGSTFTLTMPAA